MPKNILPKRRKVESDNSGNEDFLKSFIDPSQLLRSGISITLF